MWRVARMERSAIRGFSQADRLVPDFASLHPGYNTIRRLAFAGATMDRSYTPAIITYLISTYSSMP